MMRESTAIKRVVRLWEARAEGKRLSGLCAFCDLADERFAALIDDEKEAFALAGIDADIDGACFLCPIYQRFGTICDPSPEETETLIWKWSFACHFGDDALPIAAEILAWLRSHFTEA